VAAAAAKIAGVRKVISCDHVSLTRQLAESMEEVIVPLMGGYDAVLAPDTTTHKNYMPRIAAKLDVQQISSITGVESADTFVRPIYAGNAMATVQSTDAKKCVTVRTTAFAPADEGGSASVETIADPSGPFKSEYVGEELSKSDRPELTAAKVVISGGRGMGSGVPISSAQLLVHLAPLSMRALSPMIGKLAKRVKPLRQSFTSRSASPARSSIWQV